ncbi:MAG: hypothetical protein ACOYB8_04780 [Eubacteriaceae bacterium]|jgi:hypothetical protein
MEELVTILLKLPGEPYTIDRVKPNDQMDFDVETAEKVLKIPGPIKQVFITKGPSYDLYMYARMVSGDGLPYNFNLTNGEEAYGPALFVRRKNVNTEYTQYMAEDVTEEDEKVINQFINT